MGLVTGIVLTAIAVWFLRLTSRRGWTSEHWLHIPVVALAALCFAMAQALGGSGFIACFVGGLLFGYLSDRHEELLGGAASTGEVLAMLTWVAFGGPILARLLDFVTWPMLLYAVLSLTVIRILPVFLCLAGTGMSTRHSLLYRLVRAARPREHRVCRHRLRCRRSREGDARRNGGLYGAAQCRGAWGQREPAYRKAWFRTPSATGRDRLIRDGILDASPLIIALPRITSLQYLRRVHSIAFQSAAQRVLPLPTATPASGARHDRFGLAAPEPRTNRGNHWASPGRYRCSIAIFPADYRAANINSSGSQ